MTEEVAENFPDQAWERESQRTKSEENTALLLLGWAPASGTPPALLASRPDACVIVLGATLPRFAG